MNHLIKFDGNAGAVKKALEWRYAVKQFDSTKKISQSDWEILQESLRLSASSYGLQPWKFLHIESANLRKKLRPLSWNQSQIEDCSHLVVLCHRKSIDDAYIRKFIDEVARQRNISYDSLKDYHEMILGSFKGPLKDPAVVAAWTARQVYIALGTLLTTAALLHIDACPMEGFQAANYDKVLNLEGSPFASVVVCALGYRSANDANQRAKKVRFEKDELFQVL